MIPSELALAERHEVSRGTVRSALALLVDEGLIEVVPGQRRRVVGKSVDLTPSTAYERIAADLLKRLDAHECGRWRTVRCGMNITQPVNTSCCASGVRDASVGP